MGIDPSLEYLHSSGGLLYALKGEKEKAFSSFVQYNDLVKGNEGLEINGLFYTAFNYFLFGDFQEANRLIKTSLELLSKYPTILGYQENYWLKGIISFHSGDSSELNNMIELFSRAIDKYKFSKTSYHPVYKYFVHLKILAAILSGKKDQLQAYLNILDYDIVEKVKDHGSIFDYSFINYHLFKVFTSKKFENKKYALLHKQKAENKNSYYKLVNPGFHNI